MAGCRDERRVLEEVELLPWFGTVGHALLSCPVSPTTGTGGYGSVLKVSCLFTKTGSGNQQHHLLATPHHINLF